MSIMLWDINKVFTSSLHIKNDIEWDQRILVRYGELGPFRCGSFYRAFDNNSDYLHPIRVNPVDPMQRALMSVLKIW